MHQVDLTGRFLTERSLIYLLIVHFLLCTAASPDMQSYRTLRPSLLICAVCSFYVFSCRIRKKSWVRDCNVFWEARLRAVDPTPGSVPLVQYLWFISWLRNPGSHTHISIILFGSKLTKGNKIQQLHARTHARTHTRTHAHTLLLLCKLCWKLADWFQCLYNNIFLSSVRPL